MASKTPTGSTALRRALTDSDRHVRLTAAESLGKAEVAATVPVLLEALTEGSVQERGRAAIAILTIGEPARAAAQPAVPALEKKLRTRDGALDLDVADILVYIAPSRAPQVAGLLGRKTVTGQNEVQVLIRLGRADPKVVPAVIAALAARLKDAPKGVVQPGEVVRALGQFGTAGKAAVPDLIVLARGKEQALARLASRTIPLIDPEAIDYPRDLQSPPYNPNEARRPAFSQAKAVEYLDTAAQDWMRAKSCGGCHANYTYMMVRPLLKGGSPLVDDTRAFVEKRKVEKKPAGNRLPGVLISDAAALAFDDARTGKLRPSTQQALDRMWSILPLRSCDADTIVVELSPDFGTALAVVATSVAPEGYAQTKKAQEGLAVTLAYLRKEVKDSSRASLHSRALLLWVAAHQPDLLTGPERVSIVKSLLAQQHKDGGWSLTSLERESRAAKHPDAPSDGYGTGFTVYMLRQAGVPANQPEMVRAVEWLRHNQRASGRWFTPSLSAHRITTADFGTRDFYSQTVGTAFALLALESCGALQTDEGRRERGVPSRSARPEEFERDGDPLRE
jgi:squalene-hopene/tetraprenyl-beta-curcumene cyclase